MIPILRVHVIENPKPDRRGRCSNGVHRGKIPHNEWNRNRNNGLASDTGSRGNFGILQFVQLAILVNDKSQRIPGHQFKSRIYLDVDISQEHAIGSRRKVIQNETLNHRRLAKALANRCGGGTYNDGTRGKRLD